MNDNRSKQEVAQLQKAIQNVSKSLNADIILFNHPIGEEIASTLHQELESIKQKKPVVFLILVTMGGDAHAAYIIARDLQTYYDKVIICIAGDCYSAGTLIVLCAHELVITDRGRLGPLDVQILRKDELNERLSGLTMTIALEELQKKASDTFVHFASDLKRHFGRALSFRTSMEMACNMTIGMYSEVYKQVDPIRLGEDARALQIAGHYGGMLGKVSQNLKNESVRRLLEDYPSHECIIDRNEADDLFVNLRGPEADELHLIETLGKIATSAVDLDDAIMLFLTKDNKENDKNEQLIETPDTDGDGDEEQCGSDSGNSEVPEAAND